MERLNDTRENQTIPRVEEIVIGIMEKRGTENQEGELWSLTFGNLGSDVTREIEMVKWQEVIVVLFGPWGEQLLTTTQDKVFSLD